MVTATKDNLKQQCDELLFSLLGHEDLAERWWTTPNKGFEDRKPQELFEGDEAMKVFDYLNLHAYGGW